MVKNQKQTLFVLTLVQVALQLLSLSMLLITGCSLRPGPDNIVDQVGMLNQADSDAAILLAMQTAGSKSAPAPGPVSEECDNCNGTGETGDGRIVMKCRVCNGTGKKPARMVSDIDVARVLEDLVQVKPLPESCPVPEPIDYDRIVAAVQAKLAEIPTAQPSSDDVVEAVKNQLRAELSVSWTKMTKTMQELLNRVEVLENAKTLQQDVPLPPAPSVRAAVPSEPVVITVYAHHGSPEHLYARDVLTSKLPRNWQISYVFANTGSPFQMLYRRKIFNLYGLPTVDDFITAMAG